MPAQKPPSSASEEPDSGHDAWKPEAKAAEAAENDPGEFFPRVATEDARGPVPDGRRRTHGEAGN